MAHKLTINNNDFYYKLSRCEWKSNDMPGMLQSTSGVIIKDDLIENKLNQIELLEEIKNFYREIGTTSQEIYINEWILLSIENIIKMSENYKKDNIHTLYNHTNQLMFESPIYPAISIYLDIINIFLYLLECINLVENNN